MKPCSDKKCAVDCPLGPASCLGVINGSSKYTSKNTSRYHRISPQTAMAVPKDGKQPGTMNGDNDTPASRRFAKVLVDEKPSSFHKTEVMRAIVMIVPSLSLGNSNLFYSIAVKQITVRVGDMSYRISTVKSFYSESI